MTMILHEIELTEPPAPFSEAEYNLKRADDVLEIMGKMRRYWPLTVRSVYYKVISSPVYRRKHWRAQKGINRGRALQNPEEQIGDVLKYLRLFGKLPMNAINDDSRIVTKKRGKTDFEGHVRDQLSWMYVSYFDRCNAADQENYIEVWVEKNGLVHIVKSVSDEFCRRTAGCKGFTSVTLLANYAARARKATDQKQECIILYFGDCDPTGWLIPKTIKASLHHEHGIEVKVVRCGLNPEDIESNMVSIPLAGKKPIKDTFKDETGLSVGYELDLIDPEDLQEKVRAALDSYTDVEVLEYAEAEAERNNEKIDEMNSMIDEALSPIKREFRL